MLPNPENSPQSTLASLGVAKKPWTRVHIDYAGPFMGAMLFVITDAHSKWVDVHLTKTTTAQETISKFRQTFATLGLPEIIVSDNEAVFTGLEFQMFLSNNGIIHRRSSPYHPSTNGRAERMIQTMKDGLRKLDGSLETRLQRLLLSYRTTPHATTGRTRLDLIFPDTSLQVSRTQKLPLFIPTAIS